MKVIKRILFIVFASLMFNSCLVMEIATIASIANQGPQSGDTQTVATNSYSATVLNTNEELPDPSEAVVFYGNIMGVDRCGFSQMDQNYLPNCQKFEQNNPLSSKCFIVSSPVAMGSTYSLIYSKGSWGGGGFSTYWDENIPLNYTGFDIHIPNEPGLYYIGTLYGEKMISTGENVKFTDPFSSEKNMHIECLKKVKEKYKGTAWEIEADKKIAELRK